MTKWNAQITYQFHKALRAHYLKRNERVRITRTGEVHAYGVMPNTNLTGWYLVGFDTDLIKELRRNA